MADKCTRSPSAASPQGSLPLFEEGRGADCLLVEPFPPPPPRERCCCVGAPAFRGADAAYYYAKPPGGADVYKLHAADSSGAALLTSSTTPTTSRKQEAIDGDGEPLYYNPSTGFEFEWVVAPPGFYGVKEGWASSKTKAECVAAA